MMLVYLLVGDERRGPYSRDRVLEMWAGGQLEKSTLYWTERLSEWRPLRELMAGSRTELGRYEFTRDPRLVTFLLLCMLLITLAVTFVQLWALWLHLDLVRTGVTPAGAEANDARQRTIYLMALATFVVTLALFLEWVYRANLNCRGFGARGMSFTPLWTVFCYFVPFVNLVQPYQAMKEIWKASKAPADWETQRGSPLITVWWAMWLMSILGGLVLIQQASLARTPDEQARLLQALMLYAVWDSVLTVVLMAMVWTITSRQLALTRPN